MYTTNQRSFKYRSAEGDSPLPGLAEVPRNSSAYRECRGRQPLPGFGARKPGRLPGTEILSFPFFIAAGDEKQNFCITLIGVKLNADSFRRSACRKDIGGLSSAAGAWSGKVERRLYDSAAFAKPHLPDHNLPSPNTSLTLAPPPIHS